MRCRLLAALALALFVSACGSSSTAPSAPPIPSYAGTWSGTYTITGCTQSGGVALANICGGLGNTPSYGFNFQQSGSSVTGSFTLGSVAFPSTGGTVGADGSLGLSATSISNGVTIIVTWALHNSNSVITGTITQVWTSTTLSGQANVTGVIATAQHIASTRTLTPVPLTLSSLAQAMR